MPAVAAGMGVGRNASAAGSSVEPRHHSGALVVIRRSADWTACCNPSQHNQRQDA